MVLLHVLKILAAKHKWKIVIAHFNHKLRGRASDADEKLVRQTAGKMKLPIIIESADVKSFAGKSKLSIEMAARKLRHEFFAKTARKQKIKTIVLAHHADDQVELFFLRLLRGSGSEGLSGMKWQSPSPVDKTISLVRPLLCSSKAELLGFARKSKIRFRDDTTNFSNDFLRNRIRNELLPLLRKNYQPSLNKTVLRAMEILGAESEFIGDAAKKYHGKFEKLPAAIQRRVLQMQLAENGIAADFDLIESLRLLPNQFVSVGVNVSVARNEFGEIQLREEFKSEFNANELVLDLSGAGESFFSGTKFNWKFVGDEITSLRSKNRSLVISAATKLKSEFFDADKIGGKIILRHWRAGDRFHPIGMKSPKKLQNLFMDAKIPRERRHNLILAEAENGEICWVESLRISENFKITPQTKRQLVWNWRKMA